jgi:hypothetical protein
VRLALSRVARAPTGGDLTRQLSARDSVKLVLHPCQLAAAFLACTRPPPRGHSSSNQHGRLSPLIVRAQSRPIDLACASGPRVRQSRGFHRSLMVLNGGPVTLKASLQGGVTLRGSEAEFVASSQAGQEVLYLRALLKGFAYLHHGPSEIWEDNASCILMSENPTNRELSRQVDVRVHFFRDMVRDGSVKLIKCAGTQNVADALTKSLSRPAFHNHREFLKGTVQSFSDFFASAYVPAMLCRPTSRKGAAFPSPKPLRSVSVGIVYIHRYRGRAK